MILWHGNKIRLSLFLKGLSGSCLKHASQRRFASDWAASQYAQIKSQVPDSILLMQVGNFYEMYNDDAAQVSSRLPLALSKSGMAGFPLHRKDAWIPQIQSAFGSVAIADQVDPGVSTTLTRELSRIFTPGTLLPEMDIDEGSSRHLAAIVADQPFQPYVRYSPDRKNAGMCAYDNVTGEIKFWEGNIASLLQHLPGLDIIELLLIIPDLRDDACRLIARSGLTSSPSIPLTQQLSTLRSLQTAYVMGIPQNWTQTSYSKPLQELESLSYLEKSSGNVVINYLHRCYRYGIPALLFPKNTISINKKGRLQPAILNQASPTISTENHLIIDADTRESLSLTTPRGKGSLLHVLDRTVTSFGRRTLRNRLSNPLINIASINARLDMVEYFYEHSSQGNILQDFLKSCPDPLRCLGSISTRPSVETVVANLKKIMDFCSRVNNIVGNRKLRKVKSSVGGVQLEKCLQQLNSIVSSLPSEFHKCIEGVEEDLTFPASGFDTEVDEWRQEIAEIWKQAEAYVRTLFNASTLIATSENLFAIQLKPKIAAELLKRHPTLSSSRRGLYSTPELESFSIALSTATSHLSAAQASCAQKIRNLLLSSSKEFEEAARILAHLDVSTGLARVAAMQQYVRPVVTEGSEFEITQGRHAILDSLSTGDLIRQFRPNDCNLSAHSSVLITGPNMGGKSTFLRQNALLVVLAQMGSFVPAEKCIIGVVDKLFSRVGAQDNQVEGKSTFLVEMEETANIINNATSKSFVIMDEVGRGTNSMEGLSLAVAISHQIASLSCRSLSVTHHLQLPAMCADVANIGLYKFVADKDEFGRILYHHSIQPGIADDAYAIEVAQFAGHPPSVINLAKAVLDGLKTQSYGRINIHTIQDIIASYN